MVEYLAFPIRSILDLLSFTKSIWPISICDQTRWLLVYCLCLCTSWCLVVRGHLEGMMEARALDLKEGEMMVNQIRVLTIRKTRRVYPSIVLLSETVFWIILESWRFWSLYWWISKMSRSARMAYNFCLLITKGCHDFDCQIISLNGSAKSMRNISEFWMKETPHTLKMLLWMYCFRDTF